MKFDPLLIDFWKSNEDKVKYYCMRDNCGIASVDLLEWLEEKGIGTAERIPSGYIKNRKKIGGFIQVDKISYSKDDFTKEELQDMKGKGYNPIKLEDRKRYARDTGIEEELQFIPHSWVEYKGKILDPSGFLPDGSGQFDKMVTNKENIQERYKIFKNNIQINEGVYAQYKLKPESAQALADWIEENEIVEPVDKEDLHITTTYSEGDFDLQPSDKKNIVLSNKDFKIAVYGRALVIEVDSDELQDIHKAAIDAGADYKYDSYKPHITISYNSEANENLIPIIFPPNFDITLSHEEVSPLKEEIPANSTANVATIYKPLKFKMFRRKLKDNN
jgi:hypothetical protein